MLMLCPCDRKTLGHKLTRGELDSGLNAVEILALYGGSSFRAGRMSIQTVLQIALIVGNGNLDFLFK